MSAVSAGRGKAKAMGIFRKKRDVSQEAEAFNKGLEDLKVSSDLSENVALIKKLFENVDIMQYRFVTANGRPDIAIVFSDGLISSTIINDNILRPLMNREDLPKGPDRMKHLTDEVLQINELQLADNYQKIVLAVTYGDTILFADGCQDAAILNTKAIPIRSVSEPENEKTLSGPREGFNESIVQNIALVRRRARTNDLKIRNLTLGRRTRTTVMVCYLDGVVNHDVLEELMKRLSKIDIDGVLDSNYVTELIRDHRYSLFRTVGYTERPDVVIGRLLEGRIAILVDGTPVALTVPYIFIENFQANEDYYLSFYYTTFSRMLRMLGFFMTISVPGLYIAIVAFQKEMMPSPLLISITAARSSVPLPAAVEAFVMLITFDILRETGVRMPSNIGQALSIVGALVIGQSAVEAKLVAAPMIIVIAITGITNLLVPKLNAPVIYIRLFILLLSSMFGFFGFTMALSLILIHLISLTSFGVPSLTLDGDLRMNRVKDIAVRAPWWNMITRPVLLTRNRTRQRPPEGPEHA
jgi:spore germination protein KA